MYFVEKTLSPKGFTSFIVVDDSFKIVEPIALFLKHLENKDFSLNTVEKYCRNLKVYFDWLEIVNIEFIDIEPRNIIDFISFLDNKNENISPNTINNFLATISSFYQFYEILGGCISKNPIAKTKQNETNFIIKKMYKSQVETSYFKRKVSKKKTKRLSKNEIDVLYKTIELIGYSDDVIFRNKLLFKLLYESGIRIGECLGMRLLDYSEPNPSEEFGEIYIEKRSDVYHKDHLVKTNSRTIPVSMDLIFAIDEYVCNYRPQKDKIDTIFVNHGNKNVGMFVQRRTIMHLFKELSTSTNIHCTAHMLRHTHASELAEFGYDQIYISDRLGHNSIESTNKYIHPSLESQIKAYSRFINSRKDEKYEF